MLASASQVQFAYMIYKPDASAVLISVHKSCSGYLHVMIICSQKGVLMQISQRIAAVYHYMNRLGSCM